MLRRVSVSVKEEELRPFAKRLESLPQCIQRILRACVRYPEVTLNLLLSSEGSLSPEAKPAPKPLSQLHRPGESDDDTRRRILLQILHRMARHRGTPKEVLTEVSDWVQLEKKDMSLTRGENAVRWKNRWSWCKHTLVIAPEPLIRHYREGKKSYWELTKRGLQVAKSVEKGKPFPKIAVLKTKPRPSRG